MMLTGDEVQLVTFRVGGQEFGLDIQQVERILRHAPPVPVPNAPAFLEGVLAYDGGAIPVVDLRKRLAVAAPVSDETRIVVVGLGGERVGVVVDDVREVIRTDAGRIAAPPPMVRGLAAEFVTGIATVDEDRVVILLNTRRLFTSTERIALERAVQGAGRG